MKCSHDRYAEALVVPVYSPQDHRRRDGIDWCRRCGAVRRTRLEFPRGLEVHGGVWTRPSAERAKNMDALELLR